MVWASWRLSRRLQSNLNVLNAILYVAEHGCKWRGLPKRFGNWHTIYTRMNRWSKRGVLDRVFEQLQQSQVVRIRIEAVSLDSTILGRRHHGDEAQSRSIRGNHMNLGGPSAAGLADGLRAVFLVPPCRRGEP
jgi:transposase